MHESLPRQNTGYIDHIHKQMNSAFTRNITLHFPAVCGFSHEIDRSLVFNDLATANVGTEVALSAGGCRRMSLYFDPVCLLLTLSLKVLWCHAILLSYCQLPLAASVTCSCDFCACYFLLLFLFWCVFHFILVAICWLFIL